LRIGSSPGLNKALTLFKELLLPVLLLFSAHPCGIDWACFIDEAGRSVVLKNACIIVVIIVIVIVTNLRPQGRSLQSVQNLLTYKPKASSKENQRNDKATK
jgi:hypothetical protein